MGNLTAEGYAPRALSSSAARGQRFRKLLSPLPVLAKLFGWPMTPRNSAAMGTGRTPCARLQPRQFPAHSGDAGADQGLVADEPEGEADQDRREGREPRPLRRLPDGRGRHRTANVPRDFAAHRGTTAAATARASMKRLIVTRSSAIDRRNASRCQ